jgi:K+-sensing histidine kinase KdpD
MTAIGWTTSADSLIRVVYIASLAFGIPAAGIYALARWLDGQASTLEGHGEVLSAPRDESARHPFREPAVAYAVAVVAALAAWAVRALVDPILPGSTVFVTFFIAVAISGWLGGYGPALVATAISGCIALYFYIPPTRAFAMSDPIEAVRFGSFVFICLLIGGLSAALHSALRRVQSLANELRDLKSPGRHNVADEIPSVD